MILILSCQNFHLAKYGSPGFKSFSACRFVITIGKKKKDDLNNIEQITIDNPVAGNYQLKVTGYNVTTTSQNFHIVWQLDSVDKFEWQFQHLMILFFHP
jgi:hypothetical protein